MVVDTSAVLAFCLDEPRGAAVSHALAHAEAIAISSATVLECALVIGRKLGPRGERMLDQLLEGAGIEVVPFDAAQLELARGAYRRFGKGSRHPAQLNFGDCFAYALAKHRADDLLFVGDDFAQTDVTPALP